MMRCRGRRYARIRGAFLRPQIINWPSDVRINNIHDARRLVCLAGPGAGAGAGPVPPPEVSFTIMDIV